MTIWKPGMRCVCVEPSANIAGLIEYGVSYPSKGDVLTVRDEWMSPIVGKQMLSFFEHDNSHLTHLTPNGREPGFEASRFRPLSETRLDQFRQHLAPVDRERADA